MLRLKLGNIMYDRRLDAVKVADMSGVRYGTVLDMQNNKSKHWSPENLNRIMIALELKNVSDLIEYVDDQEETE